MTPEAPQSRPVTILVVDDEALIQMATSDMLQDLGHETLEASSGKEALEIIRSGAAIDLVITDQSMPGMTGVEFARAARELRPDLPILLATGYSDLPEGSDFGLPRLGKPYRQEELGARVSQLIRERR